MRQLYHSSWTARDGVNGIVIALAQTTDGYLWLGTTDGLYRFDGLNFERYKPTVGSLLASSVSSLLALSDGGLWIGYLRGGASFLKDGKVTNYSAYSGRTGFPVSTVRHFAQDWDGTIWAAVIGGLARLDGHTWHKVRIDWNYPGNAPTAIFVDNRGTLWVADKGVILFLPRRERKFHSTGLLVNFRVDAFAQLPNGDICFLDSTHRVVQTLHPQPNQAASGIPHPTSSSNFILIDRDESLWAVAQPDGVRRVPFPKWTASIQVGKANSGVQTSTAKEGLTDIETETILEDREGNIWVGTDGGLDRFRYRNLTWYGLPERHYFSLAAGDNGHVWAGTNPGDIVDVRNGKPIQGGPQNIWLAYRDPDGTLWFSATDGLWKWKEGKFSKVELPDQLRKPSGHANNKNPLIISALTRDRSGTMWVSISGFGQFQLRHGVWNFVEVVKDHPDWAARAAFTDSGNRVWLVYGEIVAVVNPHGQVQTFSARDGLSIGLPNVVGGGHGRVWVGGESGITFLEGNRFRVLRGGDGNDFGLITGIAAARNDGLWLAAGPGIVHIPEREVESALINPSYGVRYEVFDLMTDLPEQIQRAGVYSSGVVQSDGLLWFATRSGVARVDPRHIVRNTLPPPVSIRAVVADDKNYSVSAKVSLPPLTKNLRIDYAGLSLSIPERVRFRYRLENSDEDWQDAGTRREAFYRDLRPGDYRFHVIACNNDGVWNETGSILNLTVAPAWFQTKWFKLLAFALALGIILLLYLFERRRYATLLRVRFDERLEERTRLARDLHDTLLQTIQGSRLVASHARENLTDLPQAEKALDRLCSWLDRATAEGRAALNSLRNSASGEEDLASALLHIAELYAPDGLKVALSVTGAVRATHPIARDEVFRIGEEAVRNACQHSRATSLSIEARYGANLILRLRDNGIGLDPGVLESGKPGHFGIIGMQERARKIGARLVLETSSGAGACLVLTVPGKVMFKSSIVAWVLQTLKIKVPQN